MMKDDSAIRSWITAGDVLELMRDETGSIFTARDLLDFFNRDYCAAYLDCSFASGRMGEYQHLAPRIKGADYCKLLHARELLSLPEGSEPLLKGPVTVQGTAWVYSLDDKEPKREEGIWRFDFGNRPQPLYFSRAGIHALGRRIRP